MQKIVTCLWFDTNAEEAANFYTSVFKHASLGAISRYGEGSQLPEGTALTVMFTLEGQEFMALNGGPAYAFSPAVSVFVNCESQAEVDELWDKLCEGGAPNQCGWLTDKYGLSWQIVPTALGEMMQDADPARAQRVMQALLKMTKLDIAELRRAYEQA
jgi:predicted 3-demethylubiquinone-9 3-methyltransferase (glyoxalase superfamily)